MRVPVHMEPFTLYLFGVLEVLLCTNAHQPLLLDLIGQRLEAEFRTPGGQRLDDPARKQTEHTDGPGR